MRLTARWALVALLGLTVLAYHGIWTAGWVYEDENAVQADPAAHGTASVNWLRTRSLSALSHRLVYRIAGQQPRLHHVVNLGLHLVNGALVFSIAGVFLGPLGALVTAGLFLLHPLQTEAVAYIASRSELLAASFALTAYRLSLHDEPAPSSPFGTAPNWQRVTDARSLTGASVPLPYVRWGRALALWSCVGLALMAKESAIVIVPLMALTDVFRNRRLSTWRYVALALPALAIAATVFRYDYLTQAEMSRLDFAATQATAVWRYLALAIVPIGQSIDHDFEVVSWMWRYLALVGLWALLLVPVCAALAVEEEDGSTGRLWGDCRTLRLCAFGLTWLLVALSIRFAMRTTEFVTEHNTYLSFLGVWLCIGACAEAWLAPFWSDYGSAQRSDGTQALVGTPRTA